jgi:enolase-phosphatase E1
VIYFQGRGILLDIEGTTSAISYIYEVLFPYIRRELTGFLREFWAAPAVAHARERIASDEGAGSFREWCGSDDRKLCLERLRAEVLRLMDADAKTTGLKQLQGLILEEGFELGRLRAHVFPDVGSALSRWRAAGVETRIFSSGSVPAQRVFFAHTELGDLTGFLSGYYDTATGPKREPGSYWEITLDWNLPPQQVLFLSDTPTELDAARAAGLQTALVIRPGNPPAPSDQTHPLAMDLNHILPVTHVLSHSRT